MFESVRLIPCGFRVTLPAPPLGELLAVDIVGLVTSGARRSDAEQRLREGAMLSFERAHVRCSDIGLRVAIPARRLAMAPLERKAGCGMVESGRIEPDFSEIGPEVVLVTFSAILTSHRCVIALLAPNAIPQRRVALQALRVGNTAPPESMTFGAIPNAFQITMHCRELAR